MRRAVVQRLARFPVRSTASHALGSSAVTDKVCPGNLRDGSQLHLVVEFLGEIC